MHWHIYTLETAPHHVLTIFQYLIFVWPSVTDTSNIDDQLDATGMVY